ncbi:hypothetical protein [uncultured Maribacter sp.]|uniref:hypothetical protein n=1 Tax=uncultured Maribacter sp. TaxID=431308 RepID=UPI0026386C62|nr:hypothetical protein [uncultured Maribacter sp.]
MRKKFYISILIIVFSGIAKAQISGQLFQYESEFPAGKISIDKETDYVESDFDGNFKIGIPKNAEKFDLILNLNQGNPHTYFKSLKIIIENINLKNTSNIDLGKINLPSFKSIEIAEYEKLNESEKEHCYPIYCWTELLGYTYTNKLENEYLKLNCQQEITDFEYNKKTKTVKVDWKNIKNCE